MIDLDRIAAIEPCYLTPDEQTELVRLARIGAALERFGHADLVDRDGAAFAIVRYDNFQTRIDPAGRPT